MRPKSHQEAQIQVLLLGQLPKQKDFGSGKTKDQLEGSTKGACPAVPPSLLFGLSSQLRRGLPHPFGLPEGHESQALPWLWGPGGSLCVGRRLTEKMLPAVPVFLLAVYLGT